jgi:branched-chain amino acid transport system ATP-binding protein
MSLDVVNLNVFIGKLHIIQGISLAVRKSEFVALLGMNGAGKSTLLNTVAGILRPKSGTITFDGKRIEGLPPYRIAEEGVVLVPEDKKLFPELTVMDNLLLGSYTRRAKEKREDTLDLVYNLFPVLKERRNQIAMSLSGGEQKMLAVGRALMARPKLLMLDEISQGLAPKIMIGIFKTLKEIQSQQIGIVIAEQSIYQALKFSERAYIIENGRIISEESSEKLLDSEIVRKFLVA